VGQNGVKAKWGRGEPTYGGWCSTGSPVVAELLALANFDYVCLDAQHGLLGYETTLHCLLSLARSDTTPLVRVPGNELSWIGKVLDSGAQGVIIPMVETRKDAEQAVANCRIFPQGHRSYGPIRLRQVFGSDPEALNREVLCIVMIETAIGVENADEICSVPGVDAVYIGPADLAITYGLPPGLDLPPGPLSDGVDSVLRACEAHGIAAGIHCASGAAARAMVDRGFKMATIASDAMLLSAVARAELSVARG
jgi:4-hydroxy-2-oxoheptanedioate aldolase